MILFIRTGIMKLILGILCLAVAALQAKAEVSAFALDQEYQYDYNGRVATGVAEEVQQFSGYGTKGKLIIQNQGNYIYVKLNDVEIGRGNQRYDGDVREEFEYSYSTPEGNSAEIAENLQKPIRVTIENGLVQSFDAVPDDAEWSINIKRAILSLFQTNFDGTNRVRLTDDEQDQQSDNYNRVLYGNNYRGQSRNSNKGQSRYNYRSQSGGNYGSQSGAGYGSQAGVNSGSQSGTNYESQSEANTGSQSGASYGSQSGVSSGSQSGANSRSQSGARYGSQPGANSRSHSGARYGSQSGNSNQGQWRDNYRNQLGGIYGSQLGDNNNIQADDEENIYRVIEEGIGGECETVYEFLNQPNPRNRNARVLNVTKHRLYDKCINRPQLLQSNVQGQKCTECEEQGNVPLKTLSRVEYQITGDRYHFTINRISSTGLISLAPLTSQGQTITSAVNQTLELEDSRPIQQPITLGSDYVTYNSLAYSFPQQRRNPDEVDLTRAHQYNRQYDQSDNQDNNQQRGYQQNYNQQRGSQQNYNQQNGGQQNYNQQSGNQWNQQGGDQQNYNQQRGSQQNNNQQNGGQQNNNQQSGNQQSGNQQSGNQWNQQGGDQQNYNQQNGNQRNQQNQQNQWNSQQSNNQRRRNQQSGNQRNLDNAENNIQQAQRLLNEIQQQKDNQRNVGNNQQGGNQQNRNQQGGNQQNRNQQGGNQQNRNQQGDNQQRGSQQGSYRQGGYLQGGYQQGRNQGNPANGENNRLPELIIELIRVLTRLNYEDYVALQNQNNQNQQNLNQLIQVLPYVGTNPAVLYLKNLVENQDQQNVQSDLLPQAVSRVPLYVKEPSERLINEVRNLLQQQRVQANRELYNALVLAYGTLINRGCVRSGSNPQPGYAPTYVRPNVCSQYVQELLQKIQQANAQLPGSNWQQQGSYNQQQGSYNQQQGSNGQQQGSNYQQQGSYNQQQGSYSQQQGSNGQQQGSNYQQQGSYNQQQGSNDQEQGLNDQQQGLDDQQQGLDDQQQESYSQSQRYNSQSQRYNSQSQRYNTQSQRYNTQSQQSNGQSEQLTPQQSEALSQTLLYLSALINTKLPEIYEPLKQLIQGNNNNQVRQTALWGLAELLPERREEVTALLNPILHNHSEDYVTRIYAFAILLRTEPRSSYIHDLVDSLQNEPNRQVASYIYSTLVTLANSSNPCYEKIGKQIEHALQYAEPLEYEGIQYSRNKIFSYQNEKHNYGRTTQIELIGSSNSVLPREIYLRQSVNLLGNNYDILELGLLSEGTDVLTSGLLGPDGQYSPYDQSKSVFNILNRKARSVNNLEREREEINEKLNVRNRNNQPLRAQLSVKSYNQYVRNDYIDENNILDYLEQGSNILQAIGGGQEVPLNIDNVLSLTDVLLEIPNDMGFPVTIDLKVPVLARVSGGVQLNVEPGLSAEARNSQKPTSIQLQSSINVNVDYKVQGYVGITSPLQNTYGYGVSTRGSVQIPVNGQVQYDPIHKKVKVNYTPSDEQYDVLYYNSQPYTFIADRTQAVPIDAQNENLLPVRRQNNPVQRENTYGQDYLGVGVRVTSRSDDQWNDEGSYLNYVKSLFKKSNKDDDYYYLVDRLYAGVTGLVDNAILNPTATPSETRVTYEPNESHPSNEIQAVADYDYSASSNNQEFSEDNPNVVIPRVNIEKEVHGIQIEVVARGDSERRYRLNYNVSYLYKEDDTIRKTVLSYQRSPIPNYDSQEYQLNYRGGAKYPSTGRIYYGELNEDPKVEYSAVLNIGQEGDNERQIVLEAIVERSDEQKLQIRQQKEQLPYYSQCQEDLQRSNGKLGYSRACKRLRSQLARLNSLTLNLEYKGVPDNIKNLTQKVTSYLRHYFYDNVEVNTLAENPQNRVRIEANASIDRPVVDVRVHTPSQDVNYNNIYIPALIPIYEPYSAADNAKNKYLYKLLGKTSPICVLTGNQVRTFDNVTYNAPLSDCYHVVAQDYSQEGQYAVLLRNVDQQSQAKALKVYYGNNKLEVVPEGDQLVVRVDGEVQGINDGQTQVVYDNEDNQKPVYYIVNKYNKYIIVSEVHGVNINYDGRNVKIVISKYYRGNQGGICGNYDGEENQEFVGPDGCQYQDAESFVNSYAVPDGSCQVPENRKECNAENSPECTIKLNRNIYKGKGEGSRRVCFSTNPLSECRPGCKPTALVRRRAGYHCLKAQEEYTKYLLRESRQRELHEIRTKNEDFSDVVEVPVSCVPY